MSRPVVALIDFRPSAEARRETRSALESRFDLRRCVTSAASWRRACSETLDSTAGQSPPAALAVGVERAGPTLVELVQEVRQRSSGLPILAITDPCGPQALAEILASGVNDFTTAPAGPGDLVARLWRLAGPTPPGRVPDRLREKVALRRLLGDSPAFVEILQRIPPIAQSDSTVLLTGETGTGKEEVSRAIHYLSTRSGKPFVPVNCGAIPVELVENELFGHERAAFTGADRARSGLIAEAEGGTLLLDEVDCLPLPAQVKLLRFLQEKEYRPLGSPRLQIADVRLIAAANTDVERAVDEGRLRRDLYFRLNVLPLRLPPLRERRCDILLLARHFLAEHARHLDRPCPTLSPETVRLLEERDWPGNVRELRHLMERAVVMSGDRALVHPSDMMLGGPAEPAPTLSFKEAKQRVVLSFERSYLSDLLRRHEGNISQAARTAKKNRRAFFELLRKHGIDAAPFRPRI